MKVMVLYDIERNKTRKNIIDTLDEFGFYRLQKSVFIGNIKSKIYSSFITYINRHVVRGDKVYIIPMSENSYNNIRTLGESKKVILNIVKRNELEIF